MNDIEFDILDELYFVVSYPDLKSSLSLTDEELCEALQALLVKGYVKILFPDPDTEHAYDAATFGKQCRHYFYLATKAGLIVHNSI
jgi:hypothetical protein